MDESSLTLFEDHVLGQGKFGAVVLGQLSPDWHGAVVLEQQRVAVKSNRYLCKMRKREFLEEIEGAKEVGRHSRIVGFIGTVMKNGYVFHVMEHCGNGDLLGYLVRKRKFMVELQEKGIDLNGSLPSISDFDFNDIISIHDLYRISSQICAGMIYLSSKMITHNSLSSHHILITTDHNVKISDFGNISTPNTPLSTPVPGQQKWTSLELLRGEPSTQLSDVWSYGIVLWEIFTMGGRPYYNVPDQAIRGLIEKGFRLQKPEGCTIPMYQMMRETWSDNAADRPNFSQISQRVSNLARPTDSKDFMTISTSCDYYLDDIPTRSPCPLPHSKPEYDAAALISESERLLGYRM